MPELSFTDPTARIRRTVENALKGSSYESSRSEENGRLLVVEAKRANGRFVHLRFRGVSQSEASEVPAAGSALRLKSITHGGRFSLLGLFLPQMRLPRVGSARVRIDAGSARLDVVCEDAEWWEDDEPGVPAGG